jgi:transcriptional regulator with XRE-family HTH domain
LTKEKKIIILLNMKLTFTEQIKVIMKRQGYTIATLAEKMGISRQALNQKFLRDNFSEHDMIKLCDMLDCELCLEIKEKTR